MERISHYFELYILKHMHIFGSLKLIPSIQKRLTYNRYRGQDKKDTKQKSNGFYFLSFFLVKKCTGDCRFRSYKLLIIKQRLGKKILVVNKVKFLPCFIVASQPLNIYKMLLSLFIYFHILEFHVCLHLLTLSIGSFVLLF